MNAAPGSSAAFSASCFVLSASSPSGRDGRLQQLRRPGRSGADAPPLFETKTALIMPGLAEQAAAPPGAASAGRCAVRGAAVVADDRLARAPSSAALPARMRIVSPALRVRACRAAFAFR